MDRVADDVLEFDFSGEVWYWRGPAPFHFVTVPPPLAEPVRAVAAAVTYGWGMIPVRVTVGSTGWETAMFPKDGGYVLPLKDRVRAAEGIELGEVIDIRLSVRGRF